MKLVFFLLALGVCANAASISISSEVVVEKTFELPSVSALLVTELLETTFHVQADLAKAIGHLFRNVPISLAKEMIAFVVKIVGDVAGGHLDALNQYMDQAVNLFTQVIEHIDPKEVVELVAEEVLPEKWVVIIEKLLAAMGHRNLQPYVDNLIENVIDAAHQFVVSTVNNIVGGLFSLLGKREDKGLWEAVTHIIITEVTNTFNNWVTGLLGKREERGFIGQVLTQVAIQAATNAISNLLGKRSLLGDLWDLTVQIVIDEATNALGNFFGSLLGKREQDKGFATSLLISLTIAGVTSLLGKRDIDIQPFINNLVDVVIDAANQFVVNALNNVLSGFLNLLGKREDKGALINLVVTTAIETAVEVVTDAITGAVTGFLGSIGKREEKGAFGTLVGIAIDTAVDVATTIVTDAITGAVTGLLSGIGKREEKSVLGDLWNLAVDTAIETAVDVVTTAVTGAVTGLLSGIGKREERGLINLVITTAIDTAVEVVTDAITGAVTGFLGGIGKREEKGLLTFVATAIITNYVTDLVTGLVTDLLGKRQVPGY